MDTPQDAPGTDGGSNSGYHNILKRQIKKFLGENPSLAPNLHELFLRVSQTYASFEEDRTLIERSLEISSRELTENYQRVELQVADQTKELRTRTKEAEDSKLTLQSILDNLPVGVLVVNAPKGEPLMMNRAGAVITGRPYDTLTVNVETYAQSFEVTKEDGSPYPNEELPLAKTLQTGKTFSASDMFLKHADGTKIAVRAFTAPILRADGTYNSAVSVFEDISKERDLERSRDEFFAIASHELRTPLTAIRGNASMMHEYYWDELPNDDVREMIDDIHESSERLIGIVNDFLDMSRLEQKRMKFQFSSFDIVELAASVTKEFEAVSNAQNIALIIAPPSTPLRMVSADHDRLKQVLINLVGNALKFTEQGSVTIGFNDEGTRVKVFVTDTGHGMTDEAQKLVFRKFEQAGPSPLTRDSVNGTGLGLYISKLLMAGMNGDVILESSVLGHGTVFSFTVPYATVN